jgi:hypothetical protein
MFFAAVRSHGFYSSSDGVTWSRLANQPGPGLSAVACPPAPSSAGCPIYRGEISAVLGRKEMYAWYVDGSDNDQGMWKSLDGGNSWTQIATTSIAACGDPTGGCGTENGAYNLALLAIPNGATATDIYAGAVNLYKCRINSQSPACNGPNTFLNLTHAFGCAPNFGSPAHVHPAQHAIDGIAVNGAALLYFANDGGLYRALDGYTGLVSGDCAGSNLFDSLNATLGAMTQFVSFAQHPQDANTLLGGAQGNGSPATSQALVNAGWGSVNSGDGGYSEVNPADPSEWFTSTPGVNIQRCTLGVACHAADFAADPVVSSATLDGDAGPFYTPYILDPQKPAEMIVGTCRLWRGAADGTGFLPLSNNLDTGSGAICSGNEANLVRSLAAGGPQDANGLSQVIYAGTDGFGPLVTTAPAAGRVWVTKNAAGGPSSWADRTSFINPKHFPVASIALDTSDASGTTAYVAIMGFQPSRVWMTPSAGMSWFDFTGNLPNSPVNAVVVDPGDGPNPGTVYVGTDAGVFASSTASPDWTEVAPPSGSGFLPNVPVTALRIFHRGTTKLLRASTYGRGLWQFPLTTTPDFQIAVTNPVQTVFASQTAVFRGAVSALNDYADLVGLDCAAGTTPAPAACTTSPANVVPLDSGAPFVLTTADVVGDYDFKLRGVGADPAHTTHEVSLTLHVIDFGLTTPTPTGLAVNPGETSAPVTFQATAQGAFKGTITLSCTGLPADAACSFSPSSPVGPLANSPVDVSLTIRAAANSAPGVFAVQIIASTPGGPDKSQPLTLVIGKRDFSLTVANPTLTAVVNTTENFNGTLTTSNGYSDIVHISCGPGAPPTCSATPADLVPAANGAPFVVTVGSPVPQTYNFNIVAAGTDILTTSQSFPVTFRSAFDFSISADPDAQAVTAGQSATFNLLLTPDGGAFTSSVTLACAGLPSRTSCIFTPAQVSAGTGQTVVALSIQTTAPILPSVPAQARVWTGLLLPGMVLTLVGLRQKRRGAALGSLAILLAGSYLGCGGGLEGGGGGGGGQPGTPRGTYSVTVTATSSISHEVQVTLTVQ